MTTEKEMMSWRELSQKSDLESTRKKALSGAICEYIDEMEVDELMEDLLSILTKEEIYFRNRANIYAGLKESVEQITDKFKGSQDG